MDAGLLIQSGVDGRGNSIKPRLLRLTYYEFRSLPVSEWCLLSDYPKEVKTGDYIEVIAYPLGTYSYKTQSGEQKSVSRYTVKLDRLIDQEAKKTLPK